jgi:hypothetical protein
MSSRTTSGWLALKLLAGSVESFAHRGRCFGFKHAMFGGRIGWHAVYAQIGAATNWTQVGDAGQYSSAIVAGIHRPDPQIHLQELGALNGVSIKLLEFRHDLRRLLLLCASDNSPV